MSSTNNDYVANKHVGVAVGNVDGVLNINDDSVINKFVDDEVISPRHDIPNTDVETATIVDPKIFSLSDSIPCYTSASKEDLVYDQYPEVQEYLGDSKYFHLCKFIFIVN